MDTLSSGRCIFPFFPFTRSHFPSVAYLCGRCGRTPSVSRPPRHYHLLPYTELQRQRAQVFEPQNIIVPGVSPDIPRWGTAVRAGPYAVLGGRR